MKKERFTAATFVLVVPLLVSSLVWVSAPLAAISVGQRLRGEDAVSTLNQIGSQRGGPKFLFCDNGSEFTSQSVDLWAYQNGGQINYSRPGKPTDNAHAESFNGTLRAECLVIEPRSALRQD